MIDVADRRLLRAVVICNNPVLLSLFPPILDIQYNLRPRPHNFKFPEKYNVNFILRVLSNANFSFLADSSMPLIPLKWMYQVITFLVY